jgi:DNA-3-methyladenine glycosylase I
MEAVESFINIVHEPVHVNAIRVKTDEIERELARMAIEKIKRCPWPKSEMDIAYHDEEWGVPLHNDDALFEFLILEGAQAGLSWSTILNKRENYRRAFDRFDAKKMSRYTEKRVAKLLDNPGIIRNKLKVNAAIENANSFLAVQKELGTFDAYIWSFVGGRPRQNAWQGLKDLPAATDESVAMSKDLAKRGFRFVGPTICYAFMQATGMVNDHVADCFRYSQIARIR